MSTTQKFCLSFSKLTYGPFGFNPENFANIWQIKWNYIRSMKFETVRIHFFLSDVLVCCHLKILLPWQRDVMTSPLHSEKFKASKRQCKVKRHWGAGGGGGIKSVPNNGLSVLSELNLEKVRAFFPQRQSKLSVRMRCPYWAGVCNARFDSKLKFKDKIEYKRTRYGNSRTIILWRKCRFKF